MFQSISWGEYLHWLFMILSVYYVVVLALYFRLDILRLLRRRPQRRQADEDENLVDSP